MTIEGKEIIRVLLIEDNPEHADIFFETVKDLDGFDVTHVENLNAAYLKLDTEQFDIIVSDLFLPDSEGSQTVEVLKLRFPQIPLVVLSSVEDIDLAERTISAGSVDYLVKSRLDRLNLHRTLRYGVIRDQYAKLREVERGLIAAEERFRTLVKESPSAMIVTDAGGIITFINEEAEKLFAMGSNVLRGQPLPHLLSPDDEEHCKNLLKQTKINPKVTSNERRHLKAVKGNGEVFPVELRLNAIHTNDGKAIVVSIVDMTEIKKREEHLARLNTELKEERESALAAAEYKTRFLANMSHEIRTPLNAILGMGELIADSSLDPEHKRYLKILTDAGKTLLNIINSVLDLSKIDAGELIIEKTQVNLRTEVQAVVDMLHLAASSRRIFLTSHFSNDVPNLVFGDPIRIRQVIINIVNNAIKFTHTGGVNIDISLIKRGDLDCEILFKIIDTGIGIPEDKVAAIFEDYVQVDDSTTRKYGGTGLGLSICQRLVRLMGGEIKVDSVLNQGSIFSFALKFVLSNAEGIIAPIAIKDPIYKAENLPKVKILIAEDSADNRLVLSAYLKKSNVSLDFAINGAEALTKYQSKSYDVIFSDIQMPEMDGHQLARNIRRIEEEQGKNRVPLLALTAHALAEEAKKCRASGFDAHFTKPIKRNDFFKAIVHYSNLRPGKTEAVTSAKILILDDEGHLCEVLAEILAERFVVKSFTQATQALACLDAEPFDLILSDLKMPDISGEEFLHLVRRHHQGIKFLFLTGQALTDTEIDSLKSQGAAGVLNKSTGLGYDLINDVAKMLG